MADQNDPNSPQDDHPDPIDPTHHDDVPFEEEPMEEAAPRRAASAEFVVDSGVPSEAALREAMDPANQSLAEALRLSFRVLQIVILVLVVLFFASGFKTVDDGQSGVLTRFGAIVPVRGQTILEPGLQFSGWPYPIGEFNVFDVDNRQVSVGDAFWPFIPPGVSLQDAIGQASPGEMLRPQRDGYVLTANADIAHARVNAVYEIDSEGLLTYVHNVRNHESDRLVQLALRRAMVHTAARSGLTSLVDRSDDLHFTIMQHAQEVLTRMDSGIRLVSVNLPDVKPAFAIERTFRDQQNAREQAENAITQARRSADRILIDAAGERYDDVVKLIDQYEQALLAEDRDKADDVIVLLNERFDRGDLSGEVARVIQMARAYRSQVEASIGNEARRFASLLPAFRNHPDLVVKQHWFDVYSHVLSREDAEIWYVPGGVGEIKFALSGLHEIRELRQKQRLDRREREAHERAFDIRGPHLQRARDIQMEGPGRQLRIDEQGRMRGLGRQRN